MSAAATWTPITISNRHAKEMDRVGGADLILPWPDELPTGAVPAPLRPATAAEHAAAEQIVGEACRARGLIPVRRCACRDDHQAPRWLPADRQRRWRWRDERWPAPQSS